jgi:arginine decarboxylase
VFSPQILSFMRSLDTPEVHGYRPDLGYRVYVDKALEIAATARLPQPPDPTAPPADPPADPAPGARRPSRNGRAQPPAAS